MLGIMISNLANDMYAKDASTKSSSAMKIKWNQENIVVVMLLMDIKGGGFH